MANAKHFQKRLDQLKEQIQVQGRKIEGLETGKLHAENTFAEAQTVIRKVLKDRKACEVDCELQKRLRNLLTERRSG